MYSFIKLILKQDRKLFWFFFADALKQLTDTGMPG